jgi:hypothetical protein
VMTIVFHRMQSATIESYILISGLKSRAQLNRNCYPLYI